MILSSPSCFSALIQECADSEKFSRNLIHFPSGTFLTLLILSHCLVCGPPTFFDGADVVLLWSKIYSLICGINLTLLLKKWSFQKAPSSVNGQNDTLCLPLYLSRRLKGHYNNRDNWVIDLPFHNPRERLYILLIQKSFFFPFSKSEVRLDSGDLITVATLAARTNLEDFLN